MEYYSIGELCSITKGSTGIMKAVPGPYPLVTTGPDRKSSSDYEFDDEAVCIPLVSSTGHGHKSLNYIHYQSGKFALGTILAAVIPKDTSVLSAEYLQRYLFFFKDQLVVSLMKGAANVSLAVRDIAKIQVPVPPISKQKEFIELFNKAENGKLSLLHENQNQFAYLTKLRQAILQEAIEGTLTADWRKENPVRKGDPDYDAEALLEKIQAEKEKLIKEGNIKKQKPLAPIKLEEVPFDLPEGWIWTRLGEVGFINPRNYIDENLEVSFTPMPLVSAKFGVKPQFEIRKWSQVKNGFTHFAENDVAIAKITPCFENSKAGVFKQLKNRYGAGTTELHVLRPIVVLSDYIYINIKTTAFLDEGAKLMTGAVGQRRVPVDYFSNHLIPLPPIAEQQAIVDRVEKLLSMVDELEDQVSERKEQSEQLMQAVLREAFEGGK
ncbi:MAG: hypothetical protein GX556_18285 [Fibrobacter sp.]|nr:hypothetical protein [Fibrobacter sp.]